MEKASKNFNYQFKEVMQNGWSYINDSGDFLNNIKTSEKFPENTILVTGHIVGWYPSILYEAGTNAFEKILEHTKIDLFLQQT